MLHQTLAQKIASPLLVPAQPPPHLPRHIERRTLAKIEQAALLHELRAIDEMAVVRPVEVRQFLPFAGVIGHFEFRIFVKFVPCPVVIVQVARTGEPTKRDAMLLAHDLGLARPVNHQRQLALNNLAIPEIQNFVEGMQKIDVSGVLRVARPQVVETAKRVASAEMAIGNGEKIVGVSDRSLVDPRALDFDRKIKRHLARGGMNGLDLDDLVEDIRILEIEAGLVRIAAVKDDGRAVTLLEPTREFDQEQPGFGARAKTDPRQRSSRGWKLGIDVHERIGALRSSS